MPVCYGVARWSYGGDTVHAGRATVMPQKKPALFLIPVRPGCFKKFETNCPHRSAAGTENRDSVNEAL